MRILTLGCPLPDQLIDNHNWANAPSFYDYDAIVVDPGQAVSELVKGIVDNGAAYTTANDEPVLDGPTTDEAVGLADLLRQRRGEVQRLLAGGGLVVCLAYPDVPHPRVSGFNGCHRYYWLPAPEDRDYGAKFLLPAAGRHVSVTDWEHPFADYLDALRNQVRYRASIAEGASGFGSEARVLGRSNGGAALAVEIAVGGGRVIFLPALPRNLSHGERSRIAGDIVSAIRNALLTDAEEGAPEWLEQYELPGLTEAERRLDEAEVKLDEAEREVTEARNEFRAIDIFRRLLWQEGKYGLDLPVREVLTQLGLRLTAQVDEPPSFLHGTEMVLVEIEGGIGPVGMNPHYRLRQRLEQRIADSARRTRGIIVVNGQRQLPPAERNAQIETSLRVAAESMHYCVVESTTLFEALQQKMAGTFDSGAFCTRLLATEGLFKPEAAVVEPAPAIEETNDD